MSPSIAFLRRSYFLAAFLASVPAGAIAAPRAWRIDENHASVNFEIRHFFTPVRGQFTKFSGSFTLDPADLANAPKFEFTVDTASVNTANARRDAHLQTADFFDATRWKSIRFAGEKVVKTGENTYKAVGKLTIRDVTKDVEVPFTLLGVQEVRMGPAPTTVMGVHVQLVVKRSDFGVGTGSWAADTVVGSDAKLDIMLELN